MNVQSRSERSIELRQVFIHLLLFQLIALTVVECTLSTVLQASTLVPSGAVGQLNRRNGNTINAVRVSAPSVAEKISQMGPSLTMDSKYANYHGLTATSAVAAIEPIEESNNEVGETMLHKLGGLVKNAIAPTKSYVDLVNRYHKWFHNYKTLQKSSKHQLMDPSDVLKDEYAQVDELMLEEEATKHAAEVATAKRVGADNEVSEEMDPKRAENMDYIFKALRIVIDRLEKKLEDLEAREGISAEDVAVSGSEVEPLKNDERVKKAMERVKRTVMNSAKNLLTGEMAIIARTAVFNGLAQYMAAKPDVGDALDHLRPIISLMGSASTPLAVSYLMSIEFRAALAVVNQANPLSLFGINLKPGQKKIFT